MTMAMPACFSRYADRIGKGKFRDKERFWAFIAEKKNKLAAKLASEASSAKLQQIIVNELTNAFGAMLTAARNPNRGNRNGVRKSAAKLRVSKNVPPLPEMKLVAPSTFMVVDEVADILTLEDLHESPGVHFSSANVTANLLMKEKDEEPFCSRGAYCGQV